MVHGGDKRWLYGREYEATPRPTKRFVSEERRWAYVRDLLKEVERCIPTNQRQFFVNILENRAFADEMQSQNCAAKREVKQPALF